MPSMKQDKIPRRGFVSGERSSYRDPRSLDDFYITQDQIVGNAALKPEVPLDEPVRRERKADYRGETEEERQRRKQREKENRIQHRNQGFAKVLIVAFVVVIAAFMVGQAVNSNRIFTANQELQELQDKLKDAQEKTASVSNGINAEIALNDLYGYATGYLGMREATKDDITVLPALDAAAEDLVTAEPTHEPTKVSIHLFGD